METDITGLHMRSSVIRHALRLTSVALVYLGIIAAFGSVVFIGWLMSLLIW
jgi:hypothetical protein